MKLKLLAIAFLASAALVACSQGETEEGSSPTENNTVNIKEMVYDLSNRNITDKSAVILPNTLIVEDSNGDETVYDISKEDFFVSIAPYINQTHP